MEFDALDLGLLELRHGRIEAYLHSHPYDSSRPFNDTHYRPEWASHRDMEMWIALGVPFGIVATDGHGCSDVLWYDDRNRAPLEGREFVHGLHDCYSIIRDYYLSELQIDLPNFPRGWGWWNEGQNLYLEGFEQAGFQEIPRQEARVGDCIIYKIGTAYPNHASVIVGPDAILHHLIDRLSRVEKKSRWSRHEALAVRYVGVDK
ncbi:NlpC/P60 family protein [Leptothrix discophora]|uniref:NlpC/P60 family protein n=1 Tax=Leptothrix discophora TaxID=89 RepID=A0ABT9G0C4_LEPDI|nr:NlpC/P60 family protein [Leptothrix discophora]MDP4299934.1 NlpC/P60 family protein [Leptothrix discophora]